MLRLQVHDCGNGAVPVAMEQPRPRLLFLGRGWKSFARAHNLWDGHVLCFKLIVNNLLSVKIYGSSGVRLGYGEEISSWTNSPSSRGDDEDGRMVATASTGQTLGWLSLATRISPRTGRLSNHHRQSTVLLLPGPG
ncbi:L-ascorbate oxidase-like protein [Hordeum vulgare]|nr:L-ascorbate oxidase-like protein [Hordeum vulgare]